MAPQKYYNIIKRDIRSSGSQSGTVFAYIDLTESREARLQLAETEIKRQRFQQAIEAVDHSVFMTDVRGTIEYINPAFEKNTGYDRSTLIGRSPAILNAPDAPMRILTTSGNRYKILMEERRRLSNSVRMEQHTIHNRRLHQLIHKTRRRHHMW